MAHSRKASRESQQHEQEQYLTDAQRDSIDTEAKATSRDIAAAITRLSQAEKVRRQAEDVLVQKRRRKKGFGALGSWAAGGGPLEKSAEEKMEDSKMMTIAGSREGVIWYLQRGLEACGKVQSHMMEVRISREFGAKRMPKDNMAGADISNIAAIDRPKMDSASRPAGATADAAMLEEQEKNDRFMRELSPDQMQLFAEENKDLLKHYEDRLDQVRYAGRTLVTAKRKPRIDEYCRTAEKSLIEISELQSTLAGNLEIQSSNIDALVQDTDKTAENVKFGNKELRRASERRSTAKMVFYGTVSLW